LRKSEKKVIEFNLTPSIVTVISNDNKKVVLPGEVKIIVGGSKSGFKEIEKEKIVDTIVILLGKKYEIE
jgi:hypothetical protein